MKHLLYLAFAGAMLHAQPITITDTITTPMGGNWAGTVVVTLNNPQTAQPLYAGSVTLSGWSQTVTVTAGAFSITLYPNDTITPTGTSYTARYSPTSGAGWSETWVVPTGATTIRELRSNLVPTPNRMFTPSQITQAGATLNQVLRWNGATWAPATVSGGGGSSTWGSITGTLSAQTDLQNALNLKDAVLTFNAPLSRTTNAVSCPTCVITSGSYADPSWITSIGGAKVSGAVPTATALAANGTNCSAGSYPLGVDASGNAEGCTVASGGGGTVTTVSVTTANGVSGTVANATTTPAITLSLGAITPTSVAASGTVSGSNLSGTNTGDQTTITGNAGTATALQTARNINGVAFNGTANITVTANLPADPAACPSGQFVNDMAADGTLTCDTPPGGGGSTSSACEIILGDPGAATPILADDNDAPAICFNASGTTQTITEIACYSNAGTPTVNPIVTGGGGTSLLSAPLTCGTGSYATGTLNGTPTLSAGATIDANIASAGGVAKYIVIRITRQ